MTRYRHPQPTATPNDDAAPESDLVATIHCVLHLHPDGLPASGLADIAGRPLTDVETGVSALEVALADLGQRIHTADGNIQLAARREVLGFETEGSVAKFDRDHCELTPDTARALHAAVMIERTQGRPVLTPDDRHLLDEAGYSSDQDFAEAARNLLVDDGRMRGRRTEIRQRLKSRQGSGD